MKRLFDGDNLTGPKQNKTKQGLRQIQEWSSVFQSFCRRRSTFSTSIARAPFFADLATGTTWKFKVADSIRRYTGGWKWGSSVCQSLLSGYGAMKFGMDIVRMPRRYRCKKMKKDLLVCLREGKTPNFPQRPQCADDSKKGRQKRSSQTSFMMLVLVDRATNWTTVYFNKRCLCPEKIKSLQAITCDKNTWSSL